MATLLSRVNTLSGQRDWFVITDHPDATDLGPVQGYWPTQGGPASLEACQTWLANRGLVRQGDLPPDIFEYRQV